MGVRPAAHLISKGLDGILHLLAGLLTYRVGIVQHPGDGSDRDPGQFGDFRHFRGELLWWHSLSFFDGIKSKLENVIT